MRLITFESAGMQRLGAWIDNDSRIVDLAAADAKARGSADPAFASMQTLIEGGLPALDQARSLAASPDESAVVATGAVRILAPLPRPVQLRDFVGFPGHAKGCLETMVDLMAAASPDPAAARQAAVDAGQLDVPRSFYDFPIYYVCSNTSVTGTDTDVAWPPFSHIIDYELEWAAVIGKEGRNIDRADARSHIFGYTVFNDWSARDEQLKTMESELAMGPSRGKDFASTLGPCIVTADEIPDPYDLEMDVLVNGERTGGGSTGGMHYRFEDMIAYLTRASPVYPGDVIGSGTVGSGCSLENRRVVKPGDTVELRVEKIGSIRNRVVAPHLEGKLSDNFFQVIGMAMQRARMPATQQD